MVMVAVLQIMIGFQESLFTFTVRLVFVLSFLQEGIMDPAGMAEYEKKCLSISDREYYLRKTIIHPSYAGTMKTSQ